MAYEKGEKVGFNVKCPIENQYIFTAVDYFERKGFTKVSETRNSEQFIKFWEMVNRELNIILLISNGATENTSRKLCEWATRKEIKYHTASPHYPESNGRIERFNQSILQSFYKLRRKGWLKTRLSKVIRVYNNSLHEALGLTPNEMKNEENWEQARKNDLKDM